MAAPRILIIDPTPVGSLCATGQFKQMLFAQWPRKNILELTTNMETSETVLRSALGPLQSYQPIPAIVDRVKKFAPDLIYVRPEPGEFRHMDFSLSVLNEVRRPAILHIMDDWITGDAKLSEDSRKAIVRIARYFAGRSSLRYTDGPAYVADFEARLGYRFENLLNGVDFPLWEGPPPHREEGRAFALTHMGNYDAKMSRQGVLDIAQAVETLRGEFDIRFDVYLRGYISEVARKELARYKSTRVLRQSDDFAEYILSLRRSDVNVYAYNQDAASVAYMGKGIPNKTCELLAAGRPILAYGPTTFAGLTYLEDHKAARVVNAPANLAQAIRKLKSSPSESQALVDNASMLARENHNAQDIRKKFLDAAEKAVASPGLHTWPNFDDPRYDWWEVLRPALLDKRLRKTRADRWRRAIKSIPRLAVHSLLWLRTKPLSCAMTGIMAALLTLLQGTQQQTIAAATIGALIWLLSQACMRFVKVFGDRVLDPEALKHQFIERLSKTYSSPWLFLGVIAATTLASHLIGNQGWLTAATVATLSTSALFVATAAATYPRALNTWRQKLAPT